MAKIGLGYDAFIHDLEKKISWKYIRHWRESVFSRDFSAKLCRHDSSDFGHWSGFCANVNPIKNSWKQSVHGFLTQCRLSFWRDFLLVAIDSPAAKESRRRWFVGRKRVTFFTTAPFSKQGQGHKWRHKWHANQELILGTWPLFQSFFPAKMENPIFFENADSFCCSITQLDWSFQ